jgi:Na+-driven multidrug efflux pump
MRVCATTVAYVVVPIGILFLLAPQVPASLLGAAGDAPGALTAIRWVGVGFMLEPVSGFLGSALKILVSPGVDVRPLFVSLWVLTVPTLGILLALDALTVERIWLVLVGSRVVQCGLVLRVYRRWVRAGETKPHLR